MLLALGSTEADIPLPPGWSIAGSAREEVLHFETQSDADGAFELSSVPAGSYTLLGVSNVHMAATLEPVVVEPGTDQDLALVVESTAGLRGRVRAPASANCRGLVLRFVSEAPRLAHLYSRAGLFLPLTPDGSFSGTSFPAGLMHVSLGELAEADNGAGMRRSVGAGPEFTPLSIALQDVLLIEGQTLEAEFDLTGIWPERVEVLVNSSGQPAGGITVELKARGEFNVRASAVTGESGVAYLEHVPLGSYVVHLHSSGDGWTWNSESALQVTGDGLARHEVDYELATGTLTLLDAEHGTPLADQDFEIVARDGHRTLSNRTDSRGRIKLTLPVGEYRAGLAISTPGELAFLGLPLAEGLQGSLAFQWSAGGPIPAELRLEVP